MSINEILEKVKPYYTLILILVVASIFFAIGRLSYTEEHRPPIKIEYNNVIATSSSDVLGVASSTEKVIPKVEAPIPKDGPVIGSRSGKKYYYPWCGTVKRIKPENQIHFASIIVAKAAGFVPGGNCKGLY